MCTCSLNVVVYHFCYALQRKKEFISNKIADFRKPFKCEWTRPTCTRDLISMRIEIACGLQTGTMRIVYTVYVHTSVQDNFIKRARSHVFLVKMAFNNCEGILVACLVFRFLMLIERNRLAKARECRRIKYERARRTRYRFFLQRWMQRHRLVCGVVFLVVLSNTRRKYSHFTDLL
jgi:hypothetical protein